MRSHVLATLAVLLFASAPAGAVVLVPPPQDDAGSGRDAGYSPGTAVPVLPDRVYQGNLTGQLGPGSLLFGDNTDWYSFDAPAGVTVRARADGVFGCFRLLDAVGAVLVDWCSIGPYNGETTLRHTLDAAGRYHLEYTLLQPDLYFFSFSFDARPPEPPTPVWALPQEDAGTGRDAPDERAEAIHVAAGVVHEGTVGTPSDLADWYAVDLAAGDRLEVRTQGSYNCVRVHRPDGSEAAVKCALGYVELTTLVIEADMAGTWTLDQGGVGAQRYWFSYAVDEEAPSPLAETRWDRLLGAVEPEQDDAGSGADAGDDPLNATLLETGVAHRGEGDGFDADWYRFDVQEGQTIHVRGMALFTCLYLYGPDLVQVEDAYWCAAGYAYSEGTGDWIAHASGTWYVKVQTIAPETYALAVGLDAPAPALTPPVL